MKNAARDESSSAADSQRPVVVWLRQDLRLADHPALHAACQENRPVVLVYILPEVESERYPGEASCWWLHHSLKALAEQLEEFSQKLILRQGDPLKEIPALVKELNAKGVYWNQLLEPAEIKLDEELTALLESEGSLVRRFPASLLIDPENLKSKSGTPFQVFTPFWKAATSQLEFDAPLCVPKEIPAPSSWPKSLSLKEFQLEPRLNWAAAFADSWLPGEKGAQKNWQHFLNNTAENYEESRNYPAIEGTSRLSPHLHFGEITPRQIWHSGQQVIRKETSGSDRAVNLESYLREIGWREFAYYILYHFPHTVTQPLKENFAAFPWQRNQKWLKAWQRGQTGFPIVDAGMRELWETGWMHNRVRMIVASFLTKDLLIHWRAGARWFENTLVDADIANNTLGWQWTAGSGADAAPYFRIFNPILQSKKFDPDGKYITRWCPELAGLPLKYLHEPGSAPREVLKMAGVQLGRDYPEPIVDHSEQRDQALQYWEEIK